MMSKEECFVGEEKVDCPNENRQEMAWEKRILPEGFMKDGRNDVVFTSVWMGVVTIMAILLILKVKIFGKTVIEHIRPIWFYVLGAILVVLSQYSVALPLADRMPYLLNVTQALWALMVALSVMKLSKEEGFGFGSVLFLGVIYSVVIHGLKITIRYLFYGSTLFYLVDRFVYGSLLVMVIVTVLGGLFVSLRKKGIRY